MTARVLQGDYLKDGGRTIKSRPGPLLLLNDAGVCRERVEMIQHQRNEHQQLLGNQFQVSSGSVTVPSLQGRSP